MRNKILENNCFKLEVDPVNGSIESIVNQNDESKMNWVVSGKENPWHASANNWGLGFINFNRATIPTNRYCRWEKAGAINVGKDSLETVYQVGPIRVNRVCTLGEDGRMGERISFVNETDKKVEFDNIGVYVPFNDNYPDAETCVSRRCNAHIWCGGDLTHVNCLRMGGEPPHLGLVATEGRFFDYGLEGRGLIGTSSNARGDIILYPEIPEIPAKGQVALAWELFWHSGWDEFMENVKRSSPAPVVEAKEYVINAKRLEDGKLLIDPNDFNFTVENLSEPAELRVSTDGKPLKFKCDGECVAMMEAPAEPGEFRFDFSLKGKTSIVNILIVNPPEELLAARVEFIIENQRETTPGLDWTGAFLIYDNETKTQIRGSGDYNEGRERVGMGVLLAKWQQSHPSPKIMEALLSYHEFVRRLLQNKEYDVFNSPSEKHCREYNYIWVAQFHLELFKATGEKRFLDDMTGTLAAFYRKGHHFYAIGIPIVESLDALDKAGMREDRGILLANYRKQAEVIIENGIGYPVHEVNYEQTIVGPATTFLLQMFIATKDKRYLLETQKHLKCLEAFNGRQPDHHLYEIAVRHWDGWWFAKRPLWGDTFPHYWSTVSGIAFWRYWQATGDVDYLEKAKKIVKGNLSLFSGDGSASCAYLYPLLLNGHPGKYYDAYANDQDWALVNYLTVMENINVL